MDKGIIFDMDGVISDTQKLHSKVESELLGRIGVQITPKEITKKYAGFKTRDFFEEILKEQNVQHDVESLLKEKWDKMNEIVSLSVERIDGSVELIEKLHKKGHPLAVASASNLDYVERVLKILNVFEYFSFIVSGDMVSKGKPDPESFLLASSKININPENCIVIEDGVSGMMAAKKANMKCIGLVKDLYDSYPTENLVTSLAEISEEYLSKCLNQY